MHDAHFARPLFLEVVGDARVCVRVHLRVVRAESAVSLWHGQDSDLQRTGSVGVLRGGGRQGNSGRVPAGRYADGNWHAGLL